MKKLAGAQPWPLAALLLSFALLGLIYSVVNPPFEAPDELYHYALVDYVAAHWALPIQPPAPGATPGLWAQEGSQPPLAYWLAALLVRPLDRTDFSLVYQSNPYAALGEAHPDGSNVNLAIHSLTREQWPWRGTVLAVHAVRLLDVLYGVWAIYLTWRLVRTLFPQQRWLAYGSAALHAFTPMFVFVSAAVNNDALLIPLCTLALLQIVQLLQADSPRLRQWVVLGFTIGCAVLTKESALALLLFAAASALLVAWPLPASAGKFGAKFGQIGRTLIVYEVAWCLPAVGVAGWWYVRNQQLYGDWLGLNGFLAVVGRRLYPPDLWQESASLLRSYWGIFGWFNVPMASWLYPVFNGLLILAGLGLSWRLYCWLRKAKVVLYPWCWTRAAWTWLFVWAWPLAVLIALIRWTSLTPASQGRLLFPAIGVISLGFGWGMSIGRPAQKLVIGGLVLFFFGVSVSAPFAWIAPAYRLPVALSAAQMAQIEQPLAADVGGSLRLLGYDLAPTTLHPGDPLNLTLYWAGEKPTNTPQAIYIHVLGEGERIVAQRDTFPQRGLLATTSLLAGQRWQEQYQIPLRPLAYAPDQLHLAVGLYDVATGQRLPGEARFGAIALQPQPAAPLAVRFGAGLRLVGFRLNKLALTHGKTLTLTLHWQSTTPLAEDYTVSVQLINAQGQKAAQIDSPPTPPTTLWAVGQPLEERYPLVTDANAPPGLYDLRLAVYAKQPNDDFVLLPIVWDSDRMPEDHLVLTQVRIK